MKILTHSLLVVALFAASSPALAQGSGAGAGTVGAGTTSGSIGTGAAANSNVSAGSNATFDTSWKAQNTYWQNQYPSSTYYSSSRNYSTYEPAYRYGVDLYNRNPNTAYDQLNQSELDKGWTSARGNSNLNWNDAQMATRDAYNRMYQNRNSTNR